MDIAFTLKLSSKKYIKSKYFKCGFNKLGEIIVVQILERLILDFGSDGVLGT